MKAEKVNPFQRDLVKNGNPVNSAMCLGTIEDDVGRTEKVQQELLLPLDVELGGRLRHREVLVIPQGPQLEVTEVEFAMAPCYTHLS